MCNIDRQGFLLPRRGKQNIKHLLKTVCQNNENLHKKLKCPYRSSRKTKVNYNVTKNVCIKQLLTFKITGNKQKAKGK